MERIKSELEELIATGYDFEAMMDIGIMKAVHVIC